MSELYVIITTTDIVKIANVKPNSETNRICDQILLRQKNK